MSNITKKLIEAYLEISEKKKLDPVDAKALKGKYDDREDGDIDNDGDEDESDEYLHNRRKAVKKAMDEGKEECPKCEGEGCDHCDDKGYHMTNEAVELDEMTSAQKAKFDKLYKKMLNGPEHKKIMSKADNKIKGDDQFHALVKKMAMEEVSEAMTISRKMAQRALASVKAQPKDKVSLKKAPWDKDKKSTNEEEVVMNPKHKKNEKGSDTMANEEVELDEAKINGPDGIAKVVAKQIGNSKKLDRYDQINLIRKTLEKTGNKILSTDREYIDDVLDILYDKHKIRESVELPTIYSRILEARKRPEGEKAGETAAKGEMDFVKTHTDNIKVNDDDEKGHDDASKAGRASPNAKARSGDNMKGDKKVIPSATKMKG